MKKIEDKETEKYVFDSRRHELTRTVESEGNIPIGQNKNAGQFTSKSVQKYDEEGIKELAQQLKDWVNNLENTRGNMNRQLEALKDVEMNPELEKLDEQLQTLGKYRQKKQLLEQKNTVDKQHKEAMKQLNEVKAVVKNHVKV